MSRRTARPAAPDAGRRALRAVLGAAAVAALAGGAWNGYQAAATWPIDSVRFTGKLAAVSRSDLERLSASVRGMPAGGATLEAIRDAARRVAWVRDATVRRRFPDAIEVRIESYEVLARWDEATLVSVQGELFAADHVGPLPRFTGPEGGAPAMAREYPRLTLAIEPLGSPLAELRLSARGAWQAVLASGLVLELGRGDIHARLRRFVEAWPRMTPEPAPVHADLRYPNGFALRRAAPTRAKG